MSMLFFVPQFVICETKSGYLPYRAVLNTYMEMLKCWINYFRSEDFADCIFLWYTVKNM